MELNEIRTTGSGVISIFVDGVLISFLLVAKNYLKNFKKNVPFLKTFYYLMCYILCMRPGA